MAIDDKLEKVLDFFEREGSITVQEKGLGALINAIPVVGGSISALLAGQARQRLTERATEMFRAMRERIENVEEKQIDKEFFGSEEFQTLLALAIEQLQTTHDNQKVHQLGAALAHSGMEEFKCVTHKETFLRVLRDLTTEHIRLLDYLSPQFPLDDGMVVRSGREIKNPSSGTLLLIERLVSLGLVEERWEKKDVAMPPNFPNIYSLASPEKKVSDALTKLRAETQKYIKLVNSVPERCFRSSELGQEFLRFIDCGGLSAPQSEVDSKP